MNNNPTPSNNPRQNVSSASPNRNQHKYTVVQYDKFKETTTTEWIDPIDHEAFSGPWGPCFNMKINAAHTGSLELTLRHVKSSDAEHLMIHYTHNVHRITDGESRNSVFDVGSQYATTMGARNGELTIHIDGRKNINLKPIETSNTDSHAGKGFEILEETGYYLTSIEELKQIATANKVDILMSGSAMNFEMNQQSNLKFLFMVRSFLSDVAGVRTYDQWIAQTLVQALPKQKESKLFLVVVAVMVLIIVLGTIFGLSFLRRWLFHS